MLPIGMIVAALWSFVWDYGGAWLIGPMVYIKNFRYILTIFTNNIYLVLLPMAPRNLGGSKSQLKETALLCFSCVQDCLIACWIMFTFLCGCLEWK